MGNRLIAGFVVVLALDAPVKARDGVVTSVSDAAFSLSLGAPDGVRVGMTGRVLAPYTVGGRTTLEEIATFRITAVRDRECDARRTAGNVRLAVGHEVVFDQPVVRPTALPTRTPAPPRATPKQTPRSDPRVLDAQCEAASRESRWQDALTACGTLVGMVPGDVLARQRLEGARAALAEVSAAADRERRLQAANADYLVDKGDGLAATGDWALAAGYYAHVAEIDPVYRDAAALQA